MKKFLSDEVHHAAKILLCFSLVTVLISGSFNFLSSHILSNVSWGIYDRSFWVNLLINVNSSIIDFFFLALLINHFEKKRANRKEEDSLMQELQDYAFHSTLELNLKKVGIIKKLCGMGANKLNVQRMRIHEVEIKDLIIMQSNLDGLSLYKCNLARISFENCDIRSLNLVEATAKHVVFKNCKIKNLKMSNGKFTSVKFTNCSLINARMNNADLNSAIFKNCDLQDATFENSFMRSTNLLDSQNIDISELCKAKNLDYMVADERILQGIHREISGTERKVKFKKGK